MISLFVPLAQFIGTVLQFVAALLSRDRRAMVLDRPAKVLSLAKKLKAAGLTARDLQMLERRLTREGLTSSVWQLWEGTRSGSGFGDRPSAVKRGAQLGDIKQ